LTLALVYYYLIIITIIIDDIIFIYSIFLDRFSLHQIEHELSTEIKPIPKVIDTSLYVADELASENGGDERGRGDEKGPSRTEGPGATSAPGGAPARAAKDSAARRGAGGPRLD